MDVVLCAFRVVQKRRGKERVGVCGRGKYPGAPPHHQRKKREKLVDRKERYLPAKELRPGKTEITRTSTRTKWRLCSGRFEIQTERSDLSLSGSSFGVLRGLIRRFCCRCGRCWLPERRGSARILSGLWSSSAGREREGQEREDSQERFSHRREVFFGGGGGDKKSVTPKIRKFRFNWGSQWDAIQHVTEDHTALQTGTGDFVKIPKIGAISM
ncbi:hypothetical protein GEV33_015294 [Tenebrio molitor]|uniref:Uncharacterized protein n=1 Tax=Tenebrio molitor TaxID=7067 RepID=A0A8J6H598_TENMO|nr:hypothetical protein GEV33_015294 [Tenebrio molitor]